MRICWLIFNLLAGIASIVSIIIALYGPTQYAALGFHIFLILLLLSYIVFKFYELRIIKKEKFQNIFVYYKWTLFNEKNAQYESFKIIKSNRPYLNDITSVHVWSGSGNITVSSPSALIKYDVSSSKIKIKYPVSLCLNEVKAIHYTIKTEDIAGKQCNYLNCGGKNKIDMLILEAVLLDKDEMPDAQIIVTEIGESFHAGKPIATVPFDQATHTFHWELIDFSGNCVYWMVWGDGKMIS